MYGQKVMVCDNGHFNDTKGARTMSEEKFNRMVKAMLSTIDTEDLAREINSRDDRRKYKLELESSDPGYPATDVYVEDFLAATALDNPNAGVDVPNAIADMLTAIGSERVANWYDDGRADGRNGGCAVTLADRQEIALDSMGVDRLILWIKHNDGEGAVRAEFGLGINKSDLTAYISEAQDAITEARNYCDEADSAIDAARDALPDE